MTSKAAEPGKPSVANGCQQVNCAGDGRKRVIGEDSGERERGIKAGVWIFKPYFFHLPTLTDMMDE